MSSYFEDQLREFIRESVGDYADEDHDHSDDNNFEDKVYLYLGDRFRVGQGCNVQRAFETAVRAIVADCTASSESHEDGLVRGVLHSILAKARGVPSMAALPILCACSDALQAYTPPQPYHPYEPVTQAERINS